MYGPRSPRQLQNRYATGQPQCQEPPRVTAAGHQHADGSGNRRRLPRREERVHELFGVVWRSFEMKNGKGATAGVSGGAPYHRESERLVELPRRLILLVDVYGKDAGSEALGVRHEESASTLSVVLRINEESLNRVVDDAQKADQYHGALQHPPIDVVALEFFGDERAECQDLGVGKKVMGRTDGALPHLEQTHPVSDLRRSHLERS